MNDNRNPIAKPEFPRSNRYDPAWVMDYQMGPNALWLAEWLGTAIRLEPGMRVLDLGYLTRFVRPGGQLGVVVPGLVQPLPPTGPPPHLAEPQANGTAFWEDECASFHTADWWRALWSGANRVDVEIADWMERGWEHWRDFERALEAAGKIAFPSVAEALDRDAGRFLTFVRLVARRTDRSGLNLYRAALLQSLELGPLPAPERSGGRP